MDKRTHDAGPDPVLMAGLRRRRHRESLNRPAAPVPPVRRASGDRPSLTPFYFTFGFDHPLKDRYVVLWAGDRSAAADLMSATFGYSWCSDYSAEEWHTPRYGAGRLAANSAEANGYTELVVFPPPAPPCMDVSRAGTRPLSPGQRAMIDALEDARTEIYRHPGRPCTCRASTTGGGHSHGCQYQPPGGWS